MFVVHYDASMLLRSTIVRAHNRRCQGNKCEYGLGPLKRRLQDAIVDTSQIDRTPRDPGVNLDGWQPLDASAHLHDKVTKDAAFKPTKCPE